MSDLKINNITDRTGDSGPVIAGVCTVSSGQFVVPVGPTEYRGGRGRGVWSCGTQPGNTTISGMDYVEVATTGNAVDFGDSLNTTQPTSCSSSTRGVFGGGNASPYASLMSTLMYVTISSKGGGSDFGDLTQSIRAMSQGGGDSTRGLRAGGFDTASSNVIDYVTIATTGSANNFGDLTSAGYSSSGASSPTRVIWFGAGGGKAGVIDYVTTQTKGDAIDFGDQTTTGVFEGGTASNTTRGVFAGGQSPSNINVIEYVTMSTVGNATDFGDLTEARGQPRGVSNSTRGAFGGGAPIVNTIDYITIATTGNATDFGDRVHKTQQHVGMSDVHGGLG